MGMKIGANNSNRTSVPLKKPDGTIVGTLSISKANKNTKKKKRLSYNFKRISNKIMMSKTSVNASRTVREARGTVVMLLMKKRTGDYDDRELKSALVHAKDMERIARKRKKNMEEEERVEQGGACFVEEEEEKFDWEDMDDEEDSKLSAEELEELAQELQNLIEESQDELKELTEELMVSTRQDMDEEDLDQLKKRHRADELRRIMEADMKYLKALFEKLAKDKQEGSSGNFDSGESPSGVSLELAGVDMPVETADAPVTVEGVSVDVSV